MHIRRSALALLLWVMATFSFALTADAAIQKRVALVVGNGEYTAERTIPRLPNPPNDAQDLKVALERLGFEVMVALNLKGDGFIETVEEFKRRAAEADVALFYYSGHAMELGGINYLLPVDFRAKGELAVKRSAIDLSDIIRGMEERADVNLVFLDACRDNPFVEALKRSLSTASRSTVLSRGLAQQASGDNTMIVFATAPGSTASDGKGRNSPFTSAILANIDSPGIEIETLMKRVTQYVRDETKGEQLPQRLSNLRVEFYFKEALSPVPAIGPRVEWEFVKDTDDAGIVEAFLAKHSKDVFYATLARQKLSDLTKTAEPSAKTPKVEEAISPARVESAPDPVWLKDWAQVQYSTSRSQIEAFRAKFISDRSALSLADERLAELARIAPMEVAKLSDDAAAGASALDATPRSVSAEEVQTELKRLGCYAKSIDGDWGRSSAASLASFNRYANARLDGSKLDQTLLDALKGRTDRVCPLSCPVGETLKDGDCVKIVCGSGSELGENGKCVAKKVAARPKKPIAVQKPASNCFTVDGERFCE